MQIRKFCVIFTIEERRHTFPSPQRLGGGLPGGDRRDDSEGGKVWALPQRSTPAEGGGPVGSTNPTASEVAAS